MPAKEEELTSLICHARLKISTPGGAPKGLCMPVHEPGRSGNATRSWLDNSLDPALGDCSARNTERDGVRKIVTDNVREVKSRMERYLNKVSDNQGRAFTTLSSGWIGFVPEEARKGDEAVVLRGGVVPFILRPLGKKGTWEFLGDCYIHGMMNGEGVKRTRRWEML